MNTKYMSKEVAAMQLQDLEDNCVEYRMKVKVKEKKWGGLVTEEKEIEKTVQEKHFSLVPLIDELNTYVKSNDRKEQMGKAYATGDHGWDYHNWWWYQKRAWNNELEKLMREWGQQVGGLQCLLPAHVVNEYCHPSRSFVPCPGFIEEELPRRRRMKLGIDQEEVDWFTAVFNGGKLGERLAIRRFHLKAAMALHTAGVGKHIKEDAEAIQRLWEVRQLQVESLKTELAYFTAITRHLLPMLAEVVINYL